MNKMQKRLKKSYKKLCDIDIEDDEEIDYIHFSSLMAQRIAENKKTFSPIDWTFENIVKFLY